MDISKVQYKRPDGVTIDYDLKDNTARTGADEANAKIDMSHIVIDKDTIKTVDYHSLFMKVLAQNAKPVLVVKYDNTYLYVDDIIYKSATGNFQLFAHSVLDEGSYITVETYEIYINQDSTRNNITKNSAVNCYTTSTIDSMVNTFDDSINELSSSVSNLSSQVDTINNDINNKVSTDEFNSSISSLNEQISSVQSETSSLNNSKQDKITITVNDDNTIDLTIPE